MKDSGIEWIGKIPDDWNVSRIKMLADVEQENSFVDGDWIESSYIEDEGIRYLTTGNIGDGIFKQQGSGFISNETFTKLQCKYAYPGDLIISRLNEEYGRSCILPDDYDKYVIAVDNVILRTTEEKHYICYVTQCTNYHKAVFFYARGTAMKRISRTNLGNVNVPLPTIQEQQKIANFLDDKCAKIDSLIAHEEAMIEELKAYKQSVITEAVTKGLDTSVPMKDSGVEWIGKIPEGWEINRIKFISTYNDETISDKTDPDAEIDYVDIGSVSFEKGIEKIEKYNFKSAPSRARRIARKGDVVVSTVRTYLKAITMIDSEVLIVSTGFCVIRPTKAINKYVEYFCKSNFFTDNVACYSVGISYPAINATDLVGFAICQPQKEDQQQIADYLDKKCADIDSLISVKRQKIEELKEYKKSLIYEYVTGKKEVA